MVIYKRKKVVRHRGNTTHGWGAMKKHRGAGNRGGRGMAGTGKRGDAKKPSIWADTKYFGKYGFKNKNATKCYSVNILYLETKLSTLVAAGKIKEESGKYVVNLEDFGYNKLLSEGTVTKKFMITAPYASKKAVEKIKTAGGEVSGLLPKKKKKQKGEEKDEEAASPKNSSKQ